MHKAGGKAAIFSYPSAIPTQQMRQKVNTNNKDLGSETCWKALGVPPFDEPLGRDVSTSRTVPDRRRGERSRTGQARDRVAGR